MNNTKLDSLKPLNLSRIIRIARGSGLSIAEVNQLIQCFRISLCLVHPSYVYQLGTGIKNNANESLLETQARRSLSILPPMN
jgi:signal recognition particle GTPase